jgi:hypothetical protein
MYIYDALGGSIKNFILKNLTEGEHFEELDVDGMLIIETYLKEIEYKIGLDSSGLR